MLLQIKHLYWKILFEFPPRSHFRSIARSVQRERIITLNEFDQITRKKPPTNDDLDNDADALEHIQQEKLDAE